MTLYERRAQHLKEARMFKPGSYDRQWRLRAARKYKLMINGVPVKDWN